MLLMEDAFGRKGESSYLQCENFSLGSALVSWGKPEWKDGSRPVASGAF